MSGSSASPQEAEHPLKANYQTFLQLVQPVPTAKINTSPIRVPASLSYGAQIEVDNSQISHKPVRCILKAWDKPCLLPAPGHLYSDTQKESVGFQISHTLARQIRITRDKPHLLPMPTRLYFDGRKGARQLGISLILAQQVLIARPILVFHRAHHQGRRNTWQVPVMLSKIRRPQNGAEPKYRPPLPGL